MNSIRTNNEKRIAALKTYVLWSSIATLQLFEKEDYPLFDELNYANLNHQCPWCELYGQNHPQAINATLCIPCPLECFYPKSFYHLWLHYYDFVTAGDIATIAWEEYKKYEIK